MSTAITPRRTSQLSKRQFTPLGKPEVEFDPSKSVCWVQWTSKATPPVTYSWPAVYFTSFDEAQVHNENMTASQKASFSLCLYQFWKSQSKEMPVVAQLLGVPNDVSSLPLNFKPPHFVLVSEDSFFGNFMEWSCGLLAEANHMTWEDPSIKDMFDKAVCLAFEPILRTEESNVELLECGNVPMTVDDSFQTPLKPQEKNQDAGKGNVVLETPAPGAPAPKAKAPPAKVSKVAQSDSESESESDNNATMVSPHSHSQSPEESKFLNSPEGEIHESPAHTSTSATVVSTETGEESPDQGTTDESDRESSKPKSKSKPKAKSKSKSKSLSLARPDFHTAETLEQATYALGFVGWKKVEGENIYIAPSSGKQSGKRYNLKQLKAFLKKEYDWTPKVVNTNSPGSSVAESEMQEDSSKRTPVDLKRKLSSVTPNVIEETPVRKSRRTRIKTEKSESEKKKRYDDTEEESFYRFENLMHKVLKPHLGWQYKNSISKLYDWCYMPPNTMGEKIGTHLVDYFYEEHEVEDFCRANNYWKLYAHLLEEKY